MKRSTILSAVLSAALLTGCGRETELIDDLQKSEITNLFQTESKTVETSGKTNYVWGGETETSVGGDETAAPAEEVQRLIDSAEFPEISINDNSTPDDIMRAGETAGAHYGETAEKYFGFGGYNNWKYDYDENFGHYKGDGLYTDKANDLYAPMDYAAAKQFLIESLGLTERGYEELCENSPSSYYDKNGVLCLVPGDGGGAGWSYSRIIDYAVGENESGEKTVTYSCERVGTAEEWGYGEDTVKPFTFRIALEDGVWKLDGVSYGEGFFELKRQENGSSGLRGTRLLDLGALNTENNNESVSVTVKDGFLNGNIFCALCGISDISEPSEPVNIRDVLRFYNIDTGTVEKTVRLPGSYRFEEFIGGGGDILCKAKLAPGMFGTNSVVTVKTDYSYEFSEYTVRNAALPLGGRNITQWYIDIIDADRDTKIVEGFGREADENGFETRFQIYMFPIDENRFVYRTGGYESLPCFGLYDFGTDTASDVPDSRNLLPLGVHGGKVYSVKTAWDGFGTELYATDIQTLETEFFMDCPIALEMNDYAEYDMPESGEYITLRLQPADYSSASVLYVIEPDTGDIAGEYEIPQNFDCRGMYFADNDTVVMAGGNGTLLIIGID